MWNRSSKKSSKEKFASAQEAYNCALNLLSYRDFSDKKMKERLQLKGADEEQAEQAIAKLQHYGLLDEQRYAARFFEGWLNKRCYGRLHLQAEMNKRGIRADIAQQVLEQFTPELEEQQAEYAAQLFLERNKQKLSQLQDKELDAQAKQLLNKKIYAAAGRFMAARGFSSRYTQILWEKLQGNTDI